jgi:hypothetical protein
MSGLRLVLLSIVIGLSAMAIMGYSIAQTTYPRHVNPAEITEEAPPDLLLVTIYGGVVDAASKGNYTEAVSRLKEAYRVYAPEPLRFIINRFHELLSDEVSLLNQTDVQIELARIFIEQGFTRNASKHLQEASTALAKARIIHTELEAASRELTRAIPMPLGGQLRTLALLIEAYGLDIDELAEMLKGIQPAHTSLTISVEEAEAWVGSDVAVIGALSLEDGTPLEGRLVTITIDGAPAAEAVTGRGGVFRTTLRIPYIYKPKISVQALFKPSGADVGALAASKSNEVEVNLLYLAPRLEVWLDRERVLPTESLTVTGLVDVPGLEVWLEGLNRTLRGIVDERGGFRFTFTVPPDAAEGPQTLKIRTSARHVYAPATAAVRVEVYRIPLELEVEVPPLSLAGLPSVVRGLLRGPMDGVEGAVVRVEGFGAVSVVETDGEGRFEAQLLVPLTHSSGWHQVTILVNPSEPYYKTTGINVASLILNPYLLIIPLGLAAFLTNNLFSLRRTKPHAVVSEDALPEAPEPAAGEISQLSLIYLKAAEIVAVVTGEELRASDTVRGYLDRVRPKLGRSVESFERLSFMLEEEVYGGVMQDVSEALTLLEKLRSTLGVVEL